MDHKSERSSHYKTKICGFCLKCDIKQLLNRIAVKRHVPSHPPGPGWLSSPPPSSFCHKCSCCKEKHDSALLTRCWQQALPSSSFPLSRLCVFLAARQSDVKLGKVSESVFLYGHWEITSLNKETCRNIKVNICTITRGKETIGHVVKWI